MHKDCSICHKPRVVSTLSGTRRGFCQPCYDFSMQETCIVCDNIIPTHVQIFGCDPCPKCCRESETIDSRALNAINPEFLDAITNTLCDFGQ